MLTSETKPIQSLRRRWVIPAAVFVFFFALYGLTARGDIQVADEAVVFATSINLATRHTLAIDELQWLQDQINPDRIGIRGPDHHLYGKYSPGNVIGAAAIYTVSAREGDPPLEWSGKALAASEFGARMALELNPLLGALGMAWLYLLIARRLDARSALLGVALIGLCSDWWYQSRGFLSEVGAGSFLIGALYYADEERPGLSAAAFALSLIFRPLNILAFPVWGLSVWRLRWKAAWSAVIIGVAAAFLGWYNWTRFGSPLNTGYRGEGFTGELLPGLTGVLFSPGRSIFVYSPILLLAIPGAWLLWKQKKDLTAVTLEAIGSYLIAIALWHRWDGGVTWGSRLMTPVIPLAGLFVAETLSRYRASKPLAALTAALALAGFGVQIAALAINPVAVLANQPPGLRYEDTLYTIDRSWLALQIRSLAGWQPCNFDSYLLRLITAGGRGCAGQP